MVMFNLIMLALVLYCTSKACGGDDDHFAY